VDLAERAHRFLVDALDVVGAGDVAGEADHAPAARPDRLDRGIERLAPARDDRHLGARCGEAGRDGKPDPLAAPGNDGGPPRKTDVHSILPTRVRHFPARPSSTATAAARKGAGRKAMAAERDSARI